MSYSVATIPPFDNQLKRLIKRYPSLKNEFLVLVGLLEKQPDTGIALGKNCYKIRLNIASKGRGKSGGARIITNFAVRQSTVFLLTIYDKGDKESISVKELENLLSYVKE